MLNDNDQYKVVVIKKESAGRGFFLERFEQGGWIYLGQMEQTEREPFQMEWRTEDKKTSVTYIEDFVIRVNYLFIRGEKVNEAVSKAEEMFREVIYTREEILNMWQQAKDRNQKIVGIYYVGASASSYYKEEIYRAFEEAFRDTDLEVRLAAVWAVSCLAWPKVRELLGRISEIESDTEVEDAIKSLLDTYESGVGCGYSGEIADGSLHRLKVC